MSKKEKFLPATNCIKVKRPKHESLPLTSVTQTFSSTSCAGDVLIFAKRTRWTAELCNKVIPVPALRDSSDPCPVGERELWRRVCSTGLPRCSPREDYR